MSTTLQAAPAIDRFMDHPEDQTVYLVTNIADGNVYGRDEKRSHCMTISRNRATADFWLHDSVVW